MKDAPWIGLCREESYHSKPELVGYCSDCGCSVYDDSDYKYTDGELYCEDCIAEIREILENEYVEAEDA